MQAESKVCFISTPDYDLAATLTSGQAFRWTLREGAWEGVVGARWVRLRQREGGIEAETASAVADWGWLTDYLQSDLDLGSILRTFPDDTPMRASIAACRGLRLLRQEPWECLASFILSSTKQIVQIEQIVALLCARFGAPVEVPGGHEPVHAFPSAGQLAAASEAELRGCKMGFRAPNLLATARRVACGELDLRSLQARSASEARAALVGLPGVGEKIANCVLLFAYGFQEAFPVDVWVDKAIRQLYFPKRRPTPQRLRRFVGTYFGPNAGYAQQYLFHFVRTGGQRTLQAQGHGAIQGVRLPPKAAHLERAIDSSGQASDLMLHEAGRVSDQSGGDAESALESAARHLRSSPRPAGASPARQREILRGRQTRDLLAWARENDLLIEPETYAALVEPGGEEHRVWVDEPRQLYFKATHPGRFGFSVIAAPSGLPILVDATPLEYLERLLLQNTLFGDHVNLVGIAAEPGGLVMISSQPNLTGGAVSGEEIVEFMRRLSFQPLPGLSLGNPGALAFYRDVDQVAAFDAHPANFVKDKDGTILPIDLILVRADPELEATLVRYLT